MRILNFEFGQNNSMYYIGHLAHHFVKNVLNMTHYSTVVASPPCVLDLRPSTSYSTIYHHQHYCPHHIQYLPLVATDWKALRKSAN